MYKNVSYSNMPMPVKRQREEKARGEVKRDVRTEGTLNDGDTKTTEMVRKDEKKRCDHNDGVLGNLETDDLLLLIVAFVLLMDGCDDKLLLAAIAFIFLSDRD